MVRVAMTALILTATPAMAARDPCLDYLEQREAAAILALAAIVVQTRLLVMSEAPDMSSAARKIMREASDDLASGIAENTKAMTEIMETTTCR